MVVSVRVLHKEEADDPVYTDKLQGLIRKYINQRLSVAGLDVEVKPTGEASATMHLPNGDSDEPNEPPPVQSAADQMGVPVPDGEGGLVLPPEPSEVEEPIEGEEADQGQRAFPPVENERGLEGQSDRPSDKDQGGDPASIDDGPSVNKTMTCPSDLLPDIGRVAREMVRNAEEKVAVAVGAYNAVGQGSGPADAEVYRLIGISAH